jgi:monovalent cation:H+ antiporter-2, CPA2 family
VEHPEVIVELGLVLVGLAVLARLAARLGIPTIPLYLLAGLAFGDGGILPLVTTEGFVQIGAEIGLILLLLMLGLEYSAKQLLTTLRSTTRPALLDLFANYVPGFLIGLLLSGDLIAAAFIGGVTYVSSSGVAAKLLHDVRGEDDEERGFVLSILVVEDLAMALYLPLLAALVIGGGSLASVGTALGAIAAVSVVIWIALRFDVGISRVVFSRSDEALLLTIMGLTILVAGLAELIQVSAAVAALLVGILLAGPAARGAHNLLTPLRDLFAALFFAFFGLTVNPASIPPVLPQALLLAGVTGATKFASTYLSARHVGLSPTHAKHAATILVSRGEFSIIIAGLGVAAAVDPELGPIAVSYVMLMVVAGPLLARLARTHDHEGPPATASMGASRQDTL